MKIYISGRISGLPLEEAEGRFRRAEAFLGSIGAEAVNPFDNGLTPEHSWREHMLKDIEMLFGCEGIYMLKGWQESRGAMIEYRIAEVMGLEIKYQQDE